LFPSPLSKKEQRTLDKKEEEEYCEEKCGRRKKVEKTVEITSPSWLGSKLSLTW
jgi:hypothetical protein